MGRGPARAAKSDEELAARAASGEDAAFDALVSRYQERVYRLAWRLTGEPEDALDVTQEVFLKLLRRLGSFRGESRFGTWLYRVATNEALMHRRAKKRRPAESLERFLPGFDSNGLHRSTPEALRVPAQAGERLDRERLAGFAMGAIERLPEAYRVAFVLRDLEELSTEEVARTLGLKSATVRQRVHRARLMLRGYLGHLVEENSR
jgi:RNA polymerase sigma-70 factor, ECF subfamily